MRLLEQRLRTKYVAHATTAHKRFHRPQSSLRFRCLLFSGRGRFFSSFIRLVHAPRPTVAVIEADATARRTLCSLLSTLDVVVKDYGSAESYLASPGSDTGCLITEMVLPGMSGLELLRLLRSNGVPQPIILLGEAADVRAAVAAIREGASDFFEKPCVDIAITRRVAYLLDYTSEIMH